MHVEICDVSCVLVKTVKTQKQIKYKKKKNQTDDLRQRDRHRLRTLPPQDRDH